MSWLARSIAKTLLPSSDDEEDEPHPSSASAGTGADNSAASDAGKPQSPTKGVKEDISELTKNLTRQFRGFASFLAPPPQSDSGSGGVDDNDDVEASDSPRALSGFRSDFAEIGDKVRSGISKISEHVAVSEIACKITSSFLPFGSDEESDSEANGVAGLTEEVMVFVESIAARPETWLDFALLMEEEDYDDFELTDMQQDHALAVEQLDPRLAALRLELCPAHMTERCFWLVYFVLLCPKLNGQDSELLSSPQILEARAKLSNESLNQNKTETKEVINASQIPILEVPDKSHEITKTPMEAKSSEEPLSKDIHALPSSSSNENQEDETLTLTLTLTTIPISDDKHPVVVNEVQVVDKSVIKEEGIQIQVQKFESEEIGDGDDEWLQEEDSSDNNNNYSNNNVGVLQNVSFVDDEDVSFSDLEEEEDEKK